MFVGAYSAFVDGYLAIYPVAVLRSLNINTKKKVGLCFVMGLGITAACIAIYKCTRLPELSQHTDYTFATTDLLIWTSVESNVIIIAACLPTLRPIFLLLIGRSDSSKGTSNQMARKSYQLSSLTKRSTKGGRQQYPLTTTDFEKVESAERILPPSRIRQTFDVSVVYDQKKDLPKWDNGFANVNNSCEHYVEGENAGTTKSRAMVTSGEV
ncbi:hypothetical protein MMC18_005180 [Xylographa bjoerkii]|nr:hypothetical protein [Xylographa bjoerkii]